MKIKTSELTDILLDYVVATIHPQCEGLKFELVEGFLCGTSDDGICIVFVGYGFNKEISARKQLGQKMQYADFYSPSSNWSQGGPIIEQEGIYLRCRDDGKEWKAGGLSNNRHDKAPGNLYSALTPLIAAMRCYVASKLGDDVEIPDNLVA